MTARAWKTKSRSELTEQDLAEWDRDIEDDIQREKAEYQKARRERKAARHIGCPLKYFLTLVHIPAKSNTIVALGLWLYRRHYLANRLTPKCPKAIGLPRTDLADMGMSRWTVVRALKRLEAAGLVEIHSIGRGRKTRITVLWSIE